MEITEVRVVPRRIAEGDEGKVKAFASITIDDCFVVRDLRVIEGDKGMFVAMPSRKLLDGTRRDTAHPIKTETRDYIQKKVLEAYGAEIKKAPAAASVEKAGAVSPPEKTAETTEERPAEEAGEK